MDAAGRPREGAGGPGKELAAAASPKPAPLPSPPSARPHLPSLAFPFPSALRAQRKGVLLPFPWGAPPGPLPRCLPTAARVRAPAGASDAGAARRG